RRHRPPRLPPLDRLLSSPSYLRAMECDSLQNSRGQFRSVWQRSFLSKRGAIFISGSLGVCSRSRCPNPFYSPPSSRVSTCGRHLLQRSTPRRISSFFRGASSRNRYSYGWPTPPLFRLSHHLGRRHHCL